MPFRVPGLLSTLCTAFYALFGMLLRGGKTVERCKFYKILSLITVIFTFRMFITFTYLFLFIVDADLRSMWELLPGFGSHCMVCDFRECFGKSLYGCNLLLTIQNLFLLPRDIRFSTNEWVYSLVYSKYTEGS